MWGATQAIRGPLREGARTIRATLEVSWRPRGRGGGPAALPKGGAPAGGSFHTRELACLALSASEPSLDGHRLGVLFDGGQTR